MQFSQLDVDARGGLQGVHGSVVFPRFRIRRAPLQMGGVLHTWPCDGTALYSALKRRHNRAIQYSSYTLISLYFSPRSTHPVLPAHIPCFGQRPRHLSSCNSRKQYIPVARASVLDMAARREIGKWGDSNKARMLEGACSVGTAYTIESSAYPEAAGCYFDGSDGSGTAYGQGLNPLGHDGELLGRGRMYAIPAPPRYSTASSSSSNSSWLSSITSSYTTADLFEKAQVCSNGVLYDRHKVSAFIRSCDLSP